MLCLYVLRSTLTHVTRTPRRRSENAHQSANTQESPPPKNTRRQTFSILTSGILLLQPRGTTMCLAPLLIGQTDSTEPVVVASLGVVRGAPVERGGRSCFFQPMGAARKGVPPLGVGGEGYGAATAWPVGYAYLMSLLQYRIGPGNTCYVRIAYWVIRT